MKLFKDIFIRGLQGILIGVFLVETLGVVSILLSGATASITTEFFVKQYVAGAVIGVVFGMLNLLFTSERIGIAVATVIHFIGVSLVFYPMAFYAGWIGDEAMSVLGISLVMVLVYVVIWGVCYLGWKREVDRINYRLKK